jgi:hypothetical protein
MRLKFLKINELISMLLYKMPYRKNMRKTLKKTKKYRGKYSYNKSRNTKRKYTKRNNRKNFTKRNFKYTKKLRGGSTKTKTVSWGNLRIYENEQTRQRLGIGIYDEEVSLLIHAHYILESVLDKNKLTVKISRGSGGSGVKPITYRAPFAGNKLGRTFLQPGETGKIVKTINRLNIGEYSEDYFERLPRHSSEYTIYSLEINEGTLSGGDPCIDIEVTFAHDSHPLDLKQKIENIQQTESGTEGATVRDPNEMGHLDIETLERKLNANNESIKVYNTMSGDQSDNIQKLEEQNARIQDIIEGKMPSLRSSDRTQRRPPPALPSSAPQRRPPQRRPPPPLPPPLSQEVPPQQWHQPLAKWEAQWQQQQAVQGPARVSTQGLYQFARENRVSDMYIYGLLSQYDVHNTGYVSDGEYESMVKLINQKAPKNQKQRMEI